MDPQVLFLSYHVDVDFVTSVRSIHSVAEQICHTMSHLFLRIAQLFPVLNCFLRDPGRSVQ